MLKSNLRHLAVAAVVLGAMTAPAFAQAVKIVGGASMYPARNIIQNAVNSKDHTTLVAAVKAAGLVDTLQGAGPFTVFAPTNRAFGKLPKGTVNSLVQPENKAKLTEILTYHVVPGRYTAEDLMALAAKNGGSAQLKTVEGEALTIQNSRGGKAVFIRDEKGDTARVTVANVMQSNGVIHVIDTVLMP